jgi:hypothetical protein
MDNDNNEFVLTVSIPAMELEEIRRRVLYLETVLVQVLREGVRVKEWFSAPELETMRLPGLPTHRNAITRVAREEGWRVLKVPCQGGERHVYHFSSLPRRSFEALLDLVLRAAPLPGDDRVQVPTFAVPPAMVKVSAPNATPPWVLPLMRIIRAQGAQRSVHRALAQLPQRLPAGVACPSRDEAMQVLQALGVVAS